MMELAVLPNWWHSKLNAARRDCLSRITPFRVSESAQRHARGDNSRELMSNAQQCKVNPPISRLIPA